MSSERPLGWREVTVEHVAKNEDRRRVPLSSRERETRSGPYPYWGANGVLDHIDGYLWEDPRVLIAEDGTVERDDGGAVVHFARAKFWVNNHAHVLAAASGTELRWLFYALSRVKIHSFLTGSVQLKLTQANLNRITLLKPSPKEQRRIAGVLTALDDKIAHNRVLSSGAAAAIALEAEHLCQHADSETALSSVGRFVNGKAFTKHASGSGRPILRIKELNGGLSAATLWSDISANEDNIARHHDLLFSWSGTLDVFRWEGLESLINQHIFKVIPSGDYPVWLVESWIRRHLERFRVTAKDKAVTMGHIRREDLDSALVPLPNAESLRSVRFRTDALDTLRGFLAVENHRLATIRDTLLPKLVSGELRVPESFDPDDVLGTLAEEASVTV